MTPLPSKYTSVQPASLPRKEFHAPAVDGHLQPQSLYALDQSKGDEVEWLKSVIVALEKKELDPGEWISWSSYHASQQTATPDQAISGLLPLFPDNVNSVAMVKHSMVVVRSVVQHLNPEQIPLLAVDQPLYAIGKEIQWTGVGLQPMERMTLA